MRPLPRHSARLEFRRKCAGEESPPPGGGDLLGGRPKPRALSKTLPERSGPAPHGDGGAGGRPGAGAGAAVTSGTTDSMIPNGLRRSQRAVGSEKAKSCFCRGRGRPLAPAFGEVIGTYVLLSWMSGLCVVLDVATLSRWPSCRRRRCCPGPTARGPHTAGRSPGRPPDAGPWGAGDGGAASALRGRRELRGRPPKVVRVQASARSAAPLLLTSPRREPAFGAALQGRVAARPWAGGAAATGRGGSRAVPAEMVGLR